MKTLSIQQPWATLIAAGIKDVENRTWKTKYRGKLLIHASGKKVPKNIFDQLPLEWSTLIFNAEFMGTIPELDELPTGAIVGYADLTDCVEETDSIWDGGPDCIKFVIKNAFLFDEPIRDVKGKLNIFEYPIEEKDLPPAHRVEIKEPSVEGDEFVMPISRQKYEEIVSGKEHGFFLFDTDALADLLLDYDDESSKMKRSFKTVRFEVIDGTKVRHRMISTDFVCVLDEKDEKYKQMNLYGEEIPVLAYQFKVGEKI